MRKDKLVISIVVFLLTIVLVSLLSVQFKTIEETNVMDLENMQEAELRAEISNWKTKYEEVNKKLEESLEKRNNYKEKISLNQEAGGLVDSELQQLEMLLGKTDVRGEGVIITLKDDEIPIEAEDLVEVVNELKYAGAEAISINNQRIVNFSDIVAIGNKYILVNGVRISPDYEVKAIGNTNYLSSTLNFKNSGYIDKYNNSGKSISLIISEDVEIAAYNKEINFKYVKGE